MRSLILLILIVPLLLSLLLANAHIIIEDRLVSSRGGGLQKRGLDASGNYNISIYHINDVHAHLDEFRSTGTDCTDPTKGCYGGYARVKEVIDRDRPTKEDSLFLNAGDEFQGTLFYTYYGGEKIAETINQLGFDAMTLGNHEFDGGEDKLVAFLKNLTFPVVSSNIHSNNTALASKLVPYLVFPKHRIAIVAATTETTPSISKPGPGTTFEDPLTAIQRTVDLVISKEKINRIIALTHIGYDKDIELAKKTRGISLIIGGHSHTPLGDFEGAEGKYPTIENNLDGEEVFIVTAYRWGEYLGYIDVEYDEEGKILAYTGAPIHLTNKTAQEPVLQAQIEEWRKPFAAFSNEVLGQSEVLLQQDNCQKEECTLGDFMADAMLYSRKGMSPDADFALINSGGIRADIDAGPVTRGEVLTAFPFGNSVVQLTFTGEEIWKIIESIVSGVSQFNNHEVTSFFQVSEGVRVEYNPGNGSGRKLASLEIGGKPVQLGKEYSVVTLDFLAGGGDNFWERRQNFITLDLQEEVFTRYLQEKSPVNIVVSGRIVKTDDKKGPEILVAPPSNETSIPTINATTTESSLLQTPSSQDEADLAASLTINSMAAILGVVLAVLLGTWGLH